MKKIILTVSALALVLAMLFSFTSCGIGNTPELDIDTLEEVFEDEDYDEIYTIGKNERKALENMGIYGVEDGIWAIKEGEGGLGGIDDFLSLDYCVLEFETKEQASTYHHYLNSSYYVRLAKLLKEIKFLTDLLENCGDDIENKQYNNYIDTMEELQEEFEILNAVNIGKDGNTIWIASDEAIEDTNK